MADCSCTTFSHDSAVNHAEQLKAAIETGNQNYFVRAAQQGRQAIVASMTIGAKSILDYAIMREQNALFTSLYEDAQWKPHLKDSPQKLFISALKAGNVALIKYMDTQQIKVKEETGLSASSSASSMSTAAVSSLASTSSSNTSASVSTASMDTASDEKTDSLLAKLVKSRFSRSNIQFGVLHLLALENGEKHNNEFLNYLFTLPGMKRPVDESTTDYEVWKKMWLDEKGNTPLHYAANYGNPKLFKYLVDVQQISPLEKNTKGETAFDLIDKCSNAKAKKELQAYKGFKERPETAPLLPNKGDSELDEDDDVDFSATEKKQKTTQPSPP